MLSACAEVPRKQDRVGVAGKTLAVKILKPNQRVVLENLSVFAQAMLFDRTRRLRRRRRCQINRIAQTFSLSKQPPALQRCICQITAQCAVGHDASHFPL